MGWRGFRFFRESLGDGQLGPWQLGPATRAFLNSGGHVGVSICFFQTGAPPGGFPEGLRTERKLAKFNPPLFQQQSAPFQKRAPPFRLAV